MTEKKRGRPRKTKKTEKQTTPPQAQGFSGPMIGSRQQMEKLMQGVQKILAEEEFETVEEANAFLQELLSSEQSLEIPAQRPVEEAQDLMYEAWSATGKRRVKLAQQALEISKDCAEYFAELFTTSRLRSSD